MRSGFRVLALAVALASPLASAKPLASQEPTAPKVEQHPVLRADLIELAKLIRTPDDPGCLKGGDNRSSALCAQWKATDAAADSARWAFWALWVGSATLLAAIAAAVFAGRAALYAKENVSEARRTAIAAEASLAASEKTFVAQSRPYVFFLVEGENSTEGQFGRDGYVTLRFKNYGQTPAKNVLLNIALDIISRPIGDWNPEFTDPPIVHGTLPPSEVREAILMGDAFTSQQIAAIAGGMVLVCKTSLTYDLPTGGSDSHEEFAVMTAEDLKSSSFRYLTPEERERAS